MKTFKATITNLSSVVLALIFAAGCATVTDSNIDLQEINDDKSYTTTVSADDDNWFSRIGNDMDPIIDGPDD